MGHIKRRDAELALEPLQSERMRSRSLASRYLAVHPAEAVRSLTKCARQFNTCCDRRLTVSRPIGKAPSRPLQRPSDLSAIVLASRRPTRAGKGDICRNISAARSRRTETPCRCCGGSDRHDSVCRIEDSLTRKVILPVVAAPIRLRIVSGNLPQHGGTEQRKKLATRR